MTVKELKEKVQELEQERDQIIAKTGKEEFDNILCSAIRSKYSLGPCEQQMEEQTSMKTEVINGAIYVTRVYSGGHLFEPICSFCTYKNVCEEPDKERRATCPDELWDEHNNKEMHK